MANNSRFQVILDRQQAALIAKYFDSVDLPVSSASDLLRKALQIIAVDIARTIPMPSLSESDEILSNLAQRGNGFTSQGGYNITRPSKSLHPTDLKETPLERQAIDYLLPRKPGMSRADLLKEIREKNGRQTTS